MEPLAELTISIQKCVQIGFEFMLSSTKAIIKFRIRDGLSMQERH